MTREVGEGWLMKKLVFVLRIFKFYLYVHVELLGVSARRTVPQ